MTSWDFYREMANLFLQKLLTLFLAPVACSAGFRRQKGSPAMDAPPRPIEPRP
jgi:hypothetical protein